MASDRLREVMDLCVACKACQTECPSGVDMARLKIEVTAARHAAHGAPLRARLFAGIHDLDRRVSPFAPLANRVLGGPSGRLGARWLGLAPARALPLLASETFDRWWARRSAERGSGPSTGPAVVLFADTFATFHEPRVARAAVAVIEAAGHRVIVPPRRCCGRPALSQGLVDQAVAGLRYNVAVLSPLARRGLPILVPEPSCASVFRNELPDLLTARDERAAAADVAGAIRTLDEFVADLPARALPLQTGPARALLHVHCHQRALVGTDPSVAALERIPGLTIEEPDAGCCGMAGAFGFEAEHYSVSLAMAERRLAPAIRGLDAGVPVLAQGTSCRHQIADTTGRRAEHPIELLARQLAGRS
jgi:Fe-S oxidoreductase